MIYRKEEFVEHDPNDSEFRIKQVDRLEAIDGAEQRFIGRAALNLQTPFGIEQISVSFEIEADSVEDAFRKYRDHARPKIEEFKEHFRQRMEQMRQAAQSRIVTPDNSGAARDILRFDDFKKDN